jgi:hypothetical protein
MYFALGASPALLSMQSCKNISHFQVLVIYLFATLPIKLKLGLQIGWRLLKAMHLEQSNYPANQNQGAVKSIRFDCIYYTLPRLLQGHGRCGFFRVMAVFQWIDSLAMTAAPHPRFLVRAKYWAPVEMLLGCSLSRRL